MNSSIKIVITSNAVRLVANITVQRYMLSKEIRKFSHGVRMLEIGTKTKYIKYSFLFICTELRCTKRVGANKLHNQLFEERRKIMDCFGGEKMKISFYFHDRFGVDQ